MSALIRLALAGDARATYTLWSNCHWQLLDFDSLRGAPPQRGRLGVRIVTRGNPWKGPHQSAVPNLILDFLKRTGVHRTVFPRLRLGRPFEPRLFVNKKVPPDGGWFYSICLPAHSPTDCVRKGRDSPTGKGSSESIDCGWTADLFLPDCGLKNGKYIQYSSIFQALSGRKISRCQLLPMDSELPENATGQFFPRLRLGRPFESRLFVNKKVPPDGGWFYCICLSAHSPTDCVRKAKDSPTG